MRTFLIFFAVYLSTFLAAEEVAPKKTILVLSSKGGGGHTAAANTLQTLLGDRYDFKVVMPIDQLRIWGVPSGEQYYNLMLRKGWIRSLNFIVRHVLPSLLKSRMAKIEKIIASYIKMHEPELVISLIPFVNYPATEAARKKDIPYLLVTTDNDLRNWVFEMDRLKHPHFRVTIGADLASTRGVLNEKKIPDEKIEAIGLPLRPDFIRKKDKQESAQQMGISLEKPVILLMMGGAGSGLAYDYAKKIARMDLGAHLIVIAGRNSSLKRDLQQLPLHVSNSLTVLGFTEKVADLMAISDVIITKPGPGTINEALAMNLPILIDNQGISTFWERVNVDMVLGYKVGDRIRNFSQMRHALRAYLKDEEVKLSLRKSFDSVPANRFHERIGDIIQEMMLGGENPGR